MPAYDFNEGFLRLKNVPIGQADRPPVFAQMHEFAMGYCDVSGVKFYQDAELYVRGILDTAKAFQIDIPDIVWDAYNVEAEALGVKVFFSENSSPALDQTPLIQNESDLAKLKIPNPSTSGRYPWVRDCMQVFEELTGVPTPLTFCSPFSLATLLVGYEKLVMQAYTNPQFVHKVLTVITEEVIAPFINTVFQKFPQCPAADGSDALSSLPFLTEAMLKEYSVPYILKLKELCGDQVLVRNWWGDSYARDLEGFWDQKLEVGNSVLEVQDPDLNKIGPDRVVAYALKKEVPIIFGIDQTLLSSGTPAEIEKRIKSYIEIAGEHKKLIIYLCNLNYNTPEENVIAAIQAVNKYGYYSS